MAWHRRDYATLLFVTDVFSLFANILVQGAHIWELDAY